ncbi:MAG: response regulator [Myxococcaceae bacterium]|nr:response regulator [Myxococcaceae bacterium]
MNGTRDPAITAASRKHLILVVDDDAETRAMLVELLDREGYSAAEARTGAEALRMLRSGLRPRAMLVDLTMPEMNGKVFCDACAGDHELSAIWRVIVSGADLGEISRCNAHAYLSKPLDEVTIFELLEHLTAPRSRGLALQVA